MPDDNNTPPASPQAGGNGNAPQPQAGNQTTPDPQAGDGQEPISLDAAKKLRQEAQALRQRLKAYEDAEKAAADAQLSEKQRLEKQLAEAEKKHEQATKAAQQRLIGAEVKLQAQTLGIVSPDAAAKLLDASEIEVDDDGNPKNLDALLKKLIKTYPFLVSGQQQGQQANGTPRLPAMNPGRSQITPPGNNMTVNNRPPRLSDVWKRS